MQLCHSGAVKGHAVSIYTRSSVGVVVLAIRVICCLNGNFTAALCSSNLHSIDSLCAVCVITFQVIHCHALDVAVS
jgi:hypothetical protein